jgi:hypothetical protein
MPAISYSQKDLLSGKVVEPAWYTMRVDNVGEQPSKDGGSTNYPVEAVIVKNADTGDTALAGVPISWMFNSKAIGFSRGFLESFGIVLEADKRYELSAANGKLIDVFVENDTYQGRLVNRVNHKYRPATT